MAKMLNWLRSAVDSRDLLFWSGLGLLAYGAGAV